MDTSGGGRYGTAENSSAVDGYPLRFAQDDRLNGHFYPDPGYNVNTHSQYGYDDEYSSHYADRTFEREPYRRNLRESSRRDRERSRSRSRSRSRNRDRSPARGYQTHGRERRYDDYENFIYNENRRGNNRHMQQVPPSATIVVKGLSPKTGDDDLYKAFALWGPLRHVRVIKEKATGVSRGFAFVDFPSVEAAQAMMTEVWEDGIVLDGKKLHLEYSKPTAGPGQFAGSRQDDWMCTLCGCANFARRVLCFQCNEKRTDDAPQTEVPIPPGRKIFDQGPSHVLLVRGLDESTDEEAIHNEFSKHAPVKELRLVRDKFTQVSRGYAYVSFHSVEEAMEALNATNGSTLDGNVLRITYAKSMNQPSVSAASAIEAAAYAQQYGWSSNTQAEGTQNSKEAPGGGFVWDDASGYYYDAASGFYYDANRGLYYDGNAGAWYSYNQETQEYVYVGKPDGEKEQSKEEKNAPSPEKNIPSAEEDKVDDMNEEERKPSLAESVAAAALAAEAAMKKAKESMKKGLGKKKMNETVSLWKQRQNESHVHNKPSSKHSRQMDDADEQQMGTVGRGGVNPFGADYQPLTTRTPSKPPSSTVATTPVRNSENTTLSVATAPVRNLENTTSPESSTRVRNSENTTFSVTDAVRNSESSITSEVKESVIKREVVIRPITTVVSSTRTRRRFTEAPPNKTAEKV